MDLAMGGARPGRRQRYLAGIKNGRDATRRSLLRPRNGGSRIQRHLLVTRCGGTDRRPPNAR
eukprot:10398790-Lingulodinium_polyedra.AAC.1